MRELIRVSEKIFLIILAATVIVRLAPAVPYHPQVLLFLFSELIGVFFILTQRKGDWAVSPYATGIAFFGTAAALLVRPEGTALAPEAVTVALTFTGAAIALFGKLSLRRSFGLIPANRGVKVGGAYRFVRHPMYSGYVMNHIGLLLVYFSAWNVCVYLITWTLLYLRAVEEEKFLMQDPEYVDYASKVKARMIPGLV